MRHEILCFLTALTFFTRVPSPVRLPYSDDMLNESSRYFPLVGLLVGLTGAFVFGGSMLLFPKTVAVLLSMAATVLMTGAFHEDGFADVCDGFGGGWTRERILEIMKDSRVGAFGGIGIFFILALKFFCLSEMSTRWLPAVMVAAHGFSRFTAASFLYTHTYAREEGKAKPLATRMSLPALLFAGGCGTLPLLLLPHFYLVPLPALLVRWLMGRYFTRWIGGYTGDCLGAVQQVTEIVTYLTVLAIWKFTSSGTPV